MLIIHLNNNPKNRYIRSYPLIIVHVLGKIVLLSTEETIIELGPDIIPANTPMKTGNFLKWQWQMVISLDDFLSDSEHFCYQAFKFKSKNKTKISVVIFRFLSKITNLYLHEKSMSRLISLAYIYIYIRY